MTGKRKITKYRLARAFIEQCAKHGYADAELETVASSIGFTTNTIRMSVGRKSDLMLAAIGQFLTHYSQGRKLTEYERKFAIHACAYAATNKHAGKLFKHHGVGFTFGLRKKGDEQ